MEEMRREEKSTQVIGRGEEWRLGEDGWLQESGKATGGQGAPVCAHACVFVCVCVTLSIRIKTHL